MKNTLVTTDIYLCAALMSLGAKLDGVDKSDPKHMQFTLIRDGYIFESSNLPDGSAVVSHQATLDTYEKQWANEELMVNAIKYKDAIQRIKSVVHSR